MNNISQLVVCGDLCPTEDTDKHFKEGDASNLFTDCLPLFKNAGYLLGNLEFVLTDNAKPIEKSGPILHGPKAYINVLKNSGFRALSLANNHIKDCGEPGVRSTLEACEAEGIHTFGAGRNLEEAKKPYITEVNGYRIGFLSFAEQEFNTATENSYGACFFDPYEDLDLIAETKKKVDHLIVIYHGGVEYYEYPSPLLQKKCRRFIDKGADLVTCQHSHCIGTVEQYRDRNIVYGQGNTLFGYREGNDSWNRGLLLLLTLDHSGLKVELKGITAVKEGGIRLLTHEENEELLAEIAARSRDIEIEGFIEDSWIKFCRKKATLYLPQYLSLNRYLIHLNRVTNGRLTRLLYGRKYLRSSHNIMRCEAHNEVIQTILQEKF